MNVEVRISDNSKGKCLFAKTSIKKGNVIFEEDPLVSCQFSWNSACKYKACDHCLRPLETAEENAKRLTGNSSLELPYPECCETKKESIISCSSCGVEYCSDSCLILALNQYHKVLCIQTYERNNVNPLEKLEETWKQIHYPPETSSIFLLVRLLASILQAQNVEEAIQQTLGFCHRSVNEEAELAHKFLGDQFIDQVYLLRELVKNAVPNQGIEQFLNPNGFQSLLALIGTNGQGVGSSPFSAWRQNVEKLHLTPEERQQTSDFVDKIYDDMFSHTGDFLNSEGVALYTLQSCANHSCSPNAEINFQHNNFRQPKPTDIFLSTKFNILDTEEYELVIRLSLTALKDIEPDEEICISYLGECDLDRSRHSRRKMLMENYLFACDCPKCLEQIEDADVTSEEEMSESESDN